MLEVKNLKKSYKQVKAVKGINFDVNKGEILGLLGPNGAGKSTTISMIATLVKMDEGQVIFNGVDVAKDMKQFQQKLGYVPQEIALYPLLSGYENLKFWGKVYGLSGKKLKNRIEIVSEIIGIKDRLKDKVKTYSGGMKRRLNIGVALLHEPELIIMDEPTVGIDPQSRNHILETVLKLNESGMTVIYTSHYMEEVEFLCNRICIMDQGNIIAEGSKEGLLLGYQDEQEMLLRVDEVNEELLDGLKSTTGIKNVLMEDEVIKIIAKKEDGLFKRVIDVCHALDVTILGMDMIQPNLEDVFLKLTGRALRD